MKTTLFGNFGVRNSRHNGQTQKTLQVAELLDHLQGVPIERVDTSNPLMLSVRYACAWFGGNQLVLCLGPRGLSYVARLYSLLRLFRTRKRTATFVFAVGGWLKALATQDASVKSLCDNAKVLVETAGLQKELAEIGLTASVFPNFRNLPVVEADREPPSKTIHLVYSGRISADKGFREAIALADELQRRQRSVTLRFYGPVLDRSFYSEIEARPHVSYAGCFDEPRQGLELIATCHFIVLPSRYPGECVPGSLIEAKFAGVPAIVTDWRFLPEVVCNFQTGFVCRLASFAQEAADKISAMTDEEFAVMSLACQREAQTTYSAAAAGSIIS